MNPACGLRKKVILSWEVGATCRFFNTKTHRGPNWVDFIGLGAPNLI